MNMAVSVVLYVLAVFFAHVIAKQRYIKQNNKNRNKRDDSVRIVYVTATMIVVIALLFTVYNIIITEMNPNVGGDRRNYALNFYGYRVSPSLGLNFVIRVIKRFFSNVKWLYYFSTFIPVLITMLAYRVNPDFSPRALLFLLSTQYILFTFAGLKQCYANAFGVLCMAFSLRNEGLKDMIFSVISIILAILFHYTGYFLIPLYMLLHLKKRKTGIIVFYLLMMLMVLFFEPVMLRVSSMLSSVVPRLGTKINQYFGDTASIQGEGKLTFFKGIPYYILTAAGICKRKELSKYYENYDNYLIMTSLAGVAYLASIYNGWAYRISYYFYFPAGIFYSILMQNIHIQNNKRIIGAMTLGVSFILTLRFLMLMYINYGGF